MDMLIADRRQLLLTSLLASLPAVLGTHWAQAAPDPGMTVIKPPQELTWVKAEGFPEKSVEQAPLWGSTSQAGLYYTLVRWHPGYMSAPHWYEMDRHCVVVSGTWWVASGDKFDPETAVPAPAGTFVRRVAQTPHYDGVKRDASEPAIIAICGIGPIAFHNTEPGTPGWREL